MGQHRRRTYAIGKPQWSLVALGSVCYVGLGLLVNRLPNPMVPDAILALNIVVPVIVGYFGGSLTGALVGLLGTLSNALIKLPFSGVDVFEFVAILPHTLMGAAAGLPFLNRSRIGTATTILVGHALNVIGFLVIGVLPRRHIDTSTFWTGMIAEMMVDVIFIVFAISVIERVQKRRPAWWIRFGFQKNFLWAGAGIALLSVLLVISYLSGMQFAAYLFFIPVVLVAVLVGAAEAWLLALLFSAFLGWRALLTRTLDEADSFALILVLNLVALIVGELAQNVRQQRLLAQQRAERLAVVNRVAQAVGSTLDLYELVEVLCREIAATFEPDAYYIALYDERTKVLDFRFRIDEGEQLPPERLPKGLGLTDIVIDERRPVLVSHFDAEREQWPMGELWGTQKIPQSWLGVPMLASGHVMGVICIQAYHPYAYGDEEKQFLSTIADQVAVAVANARLYEDAESDRTRLGMLYEISRQLSVSTTLDETCNAALHFASYLHAQQGDLILLNVQGNPLFYSTVPARQVLTPTESQTFARQIITHGFEAHVLETRRSALVYDTKEDPRWLTLPGESDSPPIGSAICVPLLDRDGEPFGVIMYSHTDPNVFGIEELRLGEEIGARIATTLENVRLYEDARKRRHEAETLREAALVLTTSLDLDQAIEHVLAQLHAVVPYDSASVQLLRYSPECDLEAGQRCMQIVGGRGFPNLEDLLGMCFLIGGDNPNSKVVEIRAPLVVDDVSAAYQDFRKSVHVQAEIRSWLGVPMVVSDRLVGMIALDKHQAGFYTAEHARLAQGFAAQAAIVIDNSRLFQAERKQRELAEALEAAAAIVSSTLDLDQVLDRILGQVARVVAGDAFNVMLVEGTVARVVRWRGYDRLGNARSIENFRAPLAEFPALLKMALTRESVTIPDALLYPEWKSHVGCDWMRSYVAAPIQVGGVVVGFLNVDGAQPGQFEFADARRLEAFANHAATAIENAQLYREVRNQADALADALTQLQKLDQLKSEFIQNVSHELRLPLALIRGYAELLALGELGALEAEQQEAAGIIARRAAMLGEMVEDIMLILLAEAHEPVLVPLDVGELVEDVVRDFRVKADQSGLALTLTVAPDLPQIQGEATYLRRVMDNLLSNAVKFTSQGGAVFVDVSAAADHVIVKVSDTGIGIPADQKERVFERFYQVDGSTRRRHGGAGLGLALVKEIVELHSGTVCLESEPGVGSTFVITLPTFQDVIST
ncbi:MAG: GAF domain-containing protein [Anaerolineae bacterium]|nr:GAF domain-containing protein [Anaerolineae bacterium]